MFGTRWYIYGGSSYYFPLPLKYVWKYPCYKEKKSVGFFCGYFIDEETDQERFSKHLGRAGLWLFWLQSVMPNRYIKTLKFNDKVIIFSYPLYFNPLRYASLPGYIPLGMGPIIPISEVKLVVICVRPHIHYRMLKPRAQSRLLDL